MKAGDKIIFKRDIIEASTEDTPGGILAKNGESGIIIKRSGWSKNEWYVQPNGHNPFYAYEDEFELIKS